MTDIRRSPHVPRHLVTRLVLVSLLAATLARAQTSPTPRGTKTNDKQSSVRKAPLNSADVIITDAKIYTENSSHQMVEALVVRNGKIIFTGTSVEAQKFARPKAKIERLGGKLVLPGLVDAHIHPMGIVDFGGCSLKSEARTLREIADFARGCVQKMQVPSGHWLEIQDWEYGGGNQPDPSCTTLRQALDQASTQISIVLMGWDGHHAAFNSAALALAKNAKGQAVGYSKNTLANEFAAYRMYVGVDAQGELTGDIADQGWLPIDFSQISRDQHQKLVENPQRLAQRLNSAGITAVQDADARSDGYEVYDALIQRGQLTFRLNLDQYFLPEGFRDAAGKIDYDKLFAEADIVRKKYAPSALVRADAVKVYADGVPEANPNNIPPTLGNSPRPVPYLQPIFGKDTAGALTVTGYVDLSSPVCIHVRARPDEYSSSNAVLNFVKLYGYHPGQCAISYGVPEHAPSIFNEYVKRAHLAGYTIHIHSISDEAVHMAIDAIEAARAEDRNDSRPDTLAHVQFVTPEDVVRMGKDHLYLAFTYSWIYAEPAGYDLSIVPFFNKVSGNSYEAFHDPNSYYERTTYPTKTAKNAGAILVAGSDAPVLTKDPQPFVNMEFGVTRARHGLPPMSPHQRLDIRDLIDAYTIDGARALGRASEIGSIEVGKSADFVVLDQDILALADGGHPEKIGTTKVLETWFMGKPVYTAPKEK